jgi:hypothetical protein
MPKNKQLFILGNKIFTDRKIHSISKFEKKHKTYFFEIFLQEMEYF